MSELGPNAFGELVEPGRVDCYLGLLLPVEEDQEGRGGVLVVAPRWLLHPAVPQPAGSGWVRRRWPRWSRTPFRCCARPADRPSGSPGSGRAG